MQIKLIVSAAAIALAFSVGSASAAEKYTIIEGISTTVMSIEEMAATVGRAGLVIRPPGRGGSLPTRFGLFSVVTGSIPDDPTNAINALFTAGAAASFGIINVFI